MIIIFKKTGAGVDTLPKSVSATFCPPDSTVCTITIGHVIEFSAIFDAPISTERVHPRVTAFIEGQPIPIPTPTINEACNNLYDGCPIVEGQEYNYTVEVVADISTAFTGATVFVEFALVDDNQAAFVCLRFLVTVLA